MAIHDADLEYGPTPADAQYEHTDIEPSVAWKFAIWLVAGMLISVGIVYGTFWLFERNERAADQATQRFPLGVGRVMEPPAPHLQTQPFKDIYLLRQHEAERLGSYGWVDQGAGVVRLPIDHAMDMLIQQGLPVLDGAGAHQPSQVVQDSSAGRTSAPRQ